MVPVRIRSDHPVVGRPWEDWVQGSRGPGRQVFQSRTVGQQGGNLVGRGSAFRDRDGCQHACDVPQGDAEVRKSRARVRSTQSGERQYAEGVTSRVGPQPRTRIQTSFAVRNQVDAIDSIPSYDRRNQAVELAGVCRHGCVATGRHADAVVVRDAQSFEILLKAPAGVVEIVTVALPTMNHDHG